MAQTETSFSAAGGTLPELWQDATERYATLPLLRLDGDDSIFTYADAAEIVAALSSRLAGNGIHKGDRIAIFAPFHPEAAFIFWAATGLGVVVVPLDYHLSEGDLATLCRQIEPVIIFCDRDRSAAAAATGSPAVLLDDNNDDPLPGVSFSEWLWEPGTNPGDITPPQEHDPAVILFTSGTSGSAKGVVLSHGALYRSGGLMAQSYSWRTDDLLLNLGELHTMSGLRNPCVAALHAGCSFLVAPEAIRANALLLSTCIRRHRATLLGCVPAMLKQLTRFSQRLDCSSLASLRFVLCTGSSLAYTLTTRFTEIFGIPVMNYYGLTETAGLCTGVIPGSTGNRPGSIGIPLGCRIRILDNNGTAVAIGGTGELLVRSYSLMSGYWRDQQLSDLVLKEGWFHTGDLVRQAEDGSLTLIARRSEAFKDSRGEFIHPSEIEATLELHPRIAEAGVCCFSLPEGDDSIEAFIVAPDVADWDTLAAELRSFVADRLGIHRTPARIRRVDSLPRGTNDKLLRRRLREYCHVHC